MIRFTSKLDLVRQTMNLINENGYHSLEILAVEKGAEVNLEADKVFALTCSGYLMYNNKKLKSTFRIFSNVPTLDESKEYDFIFHCTTHRLNFLQFSKSYEALVNFLKERANGQEYILQSDLQSRDTLQGHSSLDKQPSEEGELPDGEFHDNP